MKVLIKGGIWKNTEDEILKAAVSKYGKNQWARISSLLVRKTPKQCKARWYEWLDPSIKKTEWSKEEDEKLLHLAKLMPTQWRTIAPIVGRTPAQCLERYQRLLDEAEAKEAGADLGLTGSLGPESGPSADDVRRLRPGEVDPEPETKPARPDPVDMDEDEKEMLSEARARLANTQGKKAKRKARERQLEEARRLASLQKRRELKAAGIHLRMKRKKGDMDYNADIPFEKPVPLGFYDNTEEKSRPVDPGKLTNVHLSKLNRRRADIEEEKQREKKRKAKQAGNKGGEQPEGNQGRFVPAKNAKLIKAQEQEQIFKRRKLVLPAPQVGESELEDIVKQGTNTENARSLVDDDEGGMTSGLMGEYTSTPKNLPTRTPRAPPSADNLVMEARNLRALTETQTPLLGGENTPMRASQGTGFDGVTPRSNDIQTPNPLLTPRTDNSVLSTPRSQVSEPAIKRAVKEALAGLPAPRNEYEIRLPELESQQEKSEGKDGKKEEDMYDVDKRNKEKAAAQEKDALERRSSVLQRGLPRPTRSPANFWNVTSQIESLIQEEYLRLITHDMVKYPAMGSKVTPGTAALGDLEQVEQEFTPQELAAARLEMENAVKEDLGLDQEADEASVKQAMQQHASQDEFKSVWTREHEDVVLSAQMNRYLKLDDIKETKDILQGYAKVIDNNRRTMIRQAAEAGKLEKKLDIRMGGYMGRSTTLMKQINEAYDELETAMDEYVNYSNLQAMESAAVRVRVDNAQIEVDRLQSRNSMLQQRYKDLTNEKQNLIASIQNLMA
ncbi:pre-mRNA splicing factor component-domain-containing protein [Zychaea mexicana]|uniref:pre-mRNA splicing factor component-domain-containing protein n=1 Tax=Zychaea mexicana TaxID=64656 RepID=UPI0022FDD29D|nr:pre-mRNA splicing factor component-domain-containing protein [Zychaea mexicana]KAI9491325.1 pre-mRNA splicing factor component-domain-containing protein [Zychaea mexicana]